MVGPAVLLTVANSFRLDFTDATGVKLCTMVALYALGGTKSDLNVKISSCTDNYVRLRGLYSKCNESSLLFCWNIRTALASLSHSAPLCRSEP